MKLRKCSGLALLFGLLLACAAPGRFTIAIATTTSVQNSGLLDALLPALERETGLSPQLHAAGSGRSLQMLADGIVDAVISHAPEMEQRMLAKHPEWAYRKWAFNQFVVVGPAEDPARVRHASNVVDAFRRIADSGSRFVSRGDESGTHERERALWEAAGQQPDDRRLLVSGRGMAQALRHAGEAQAYTLTDAPTFWQLRRSLDLQVLFEGDQRLLNTYAVIHRRGITAAATFSEWWVQDSTRKRLTAFLIEGTRAYQPWPPGCPGTAPGDRPCVAVPSRSEPQ